MMNSVFFSYHSGFWSLKIFVGFTCLENLLQKSFSSASLSNFFRFLKKLLNEL
jgi:hypothetical protein